ncbi:hypothetical protein CBR_g34497, partial [Chara braunii]
MRVGEQLVSTGYTVTVLLRAYVDQDLTASECRQRARDLIHERRADVLARVTFQTSISYDVMIWSHGYMRAEHYHDETVAEARARVRRGYGITEYLEKWELHASRSQWSEEEIIENFLFNVDPSLGREVKEARPKDGKWTTYEKNLVELYKLEDNKYFIKDLETMTQDEDESVRAFGMRFQNISDAMMKKGKISEVERCTIFIGHLSKGRQKSILRDLPHDRLDFPEVLKLAIKAEADDYKDLVWRGMRRRDFSLYKEYATDRCPDFKDYPWSEKNEAVDEEVKEIRDMVKGLTRQPARDELQMIMRKTRIPLSEMGPPKAEASTVTVTEVTARADRMATVLLDGMEGVPPDKFYILGSGAVETIINDGAVLDAVIDNGSEAVIIDEDLAVQVGLGLDRSYLFEIKTADGRKQQITGVCHKAAIEVQGVRVTLPVFAVKNCSSDLLLGRTWLSHVHVVTIERPDGSQTLSIRKPDGTRVMIETVEPRDPRNRAALAVGARPSDQIRSLPISGRAVRFREKRYRPLLTEEEGRIVEVEDLGSRLIVDCNSSPKGKEEEFGSLVSVSFLRARPLWGATQATQRAAREESRGWYNRGDRRDESRGRYDSGDRRNDSRGRYEQGGSGGDRRNDSRGRNEKGGYGVSSEPYPKSPDPKAARNSIFRGADDRASTLRNSCVYCRGEDHIKRDCPDLKRPIDEGLVVLDDRKYVKWADDLGDVSMFPSMKENVEARRIKTSKGMEPVRSQSIKIIFEGDIATTPIRVAATKSARGTTSKKTDTDYVMTEKDGQRVDGEVVILSPRRRGVKKFLMKSSLDEIDTVEPLRRALRQPMQCSILEYLAASKPARDELQMIMRKTRIPLSEMGPPKAEASTVTVTEVTARADRMATVLLDGME